ncbi:MAG: hypothetical protein AAGH19_04240 [Pseudomonadota bacterium]
MKRTTLLLLVSVVLAVALVAIRYWPANPEPEVPVVAAGHSGPVPIGPGGAYLRGAHWFGDAWAVNFWNTRLLEQAAEDFATLRADGFNTVILVIPWPGFSPAPDDGSLDPDRVRRLIALLDLAEAAELNVVLRLGYAWDSTVAMSGRWLMELWLSEDARRGWLEHIERLWEVVKDRDHVRFAFLSWEDLWAIEGLGNGTAEERLAKASRSGYQAWLAEYSTLEAVSARYGRRFVSFDDVPVPRRMEPAFGLFFDFIDDAWINRFFKPAQAVFPRMSMEIRIDSDPVWNSPGDLAYWHSHELAWDLPGAEWTTVYWAPAMGGQNQGETLTPEQAVDRLAYLMNRLRSVTGDRPIFIDQFLVEDFTPGFEMNGRLERDAVPEFLERAQPVLESLTGGYALWTWQDYAHNAVASPDFSTLRGNWEGAKVDDDDASGYPFLAGERLQRGFGIHEFHAPGGPETATLCLTGTVDGDTAPDVLVVSNEPQQRIELDVTGAGEACVDLDVQPLTTVALEAMSDVDLLDVSFSGFIQPTGIYTIDGEPKPVAAAWKALNLDLPVARPEPFELFTDGWMGKTLTHELRAPGDGAFTVNFITRRPPDWPFEPRIGVRINGSEISTVACSDDTQHSVEVPAAARNEGKQAVALTVDRTHRPPGDERRLGCMVEALELDRAD